LNSFARRSDNMTTDWLANETLAHSLFTALMVALSTILYSQLPSLSSVHTFHSVKETTLAQAVRLRRASGGCSFPHISFWTIFQCSRPHPLTTELSTTLTPPYSTGPTAGSSQTPVLSASETLAQYTKTLHMRRPRGILPSPFRSMVRGYRYIVSWPSSHFTVTQAPQFAFWAPSRFPRIPTTSRIRRGTAS
jgi:hypothetical protein